MSILIIYKVIGWTNPIDWAEMPDSSILGYYQTREGAEAKIADMKSDEDWQYHWSDFMIDEIEVLP